ncbi:uncharacterized protein FOMMEDRAFT_133825 [Fomitiporia mediterranea MF3/22]|uniref:uncharacterized protein n=1 Tax=Fomitiporia mediterranea (strain MF3/22) TaxID=694068 RepID=UPI0004409693|nr:uncharacterized protein FOMMEDRAFT_133825 [Fomitiporia mediterranea MF3/22]EJD04595.1 hypothetical protein FOMMEDRAFT_133825 [Fomitiporia mediterranea MF3/22]
MSSPPRISPLPFYTSTTFPFLLLGSAHVRSPRYAYIEVKGGVDRARSVKEGEKLTC